ncbi:MAG: glycosyltransferase family 39 protein [Planctomycetes bacterium]|nr:glycosyltransferase family 39 protein [Planctomycetota bacterium]
MAEPSIPGPDTPRPFFPLTRLGWPELVLLAFIHRLVIALWTSTIAPDCVVYHPIARLYRDGQFHKAVDTDLHPLFPLLTGLLSHVTGSVDSAAVALSVAASSLVALPLVLLLRKAWNERIAWATGFLYALQPVLALDTSEGLPTGLFLCLFFASLACGTFAVSGGRWVLYPLAGLLAGLCYLTRTEGVFAIFFLLIGAAAAVIQSFRRPNPEAPTGAPSGRVRCIVGILAGVIALGVVTFPYLLFIREKSGRWGLTLKGGQKILDKAMGVAREDAEPDTGGYKSAAEAISDRGSLGRYLGKKFTRALFGPLVPFYVLGFLCTGRQGGRWKRLFPLPLMALVSLVPSLLLLMLEAKHMPSHRYMLLCGLLLLPWAAAAVLTLGDLLSGFVRTERRRWVMPALLLLLLLLLPLKSVGPRRPEEATYKEAGRWLAAQTLEPSRTLVASDAKIAYYGECRFVELPSIWSDLSKPPPPPSKTAPAKGLDAPAALDWARQARDEFLRSGAALLVVDQRQVEHFFGAEYLTQLGAVGFRERNVVRGDPREKSWTVWIYSFEKNP